MLVFQLYLTTRLLCYNIVSTMATQIIFQAGNSNVVAIPKELMKDFKLKKGEKVVVEKSANGEAIEIKKVLKNSTSAKSPSVKSEFNKWLRQAMKEDAEVLDDLAVR